MRFSAFLSLALFSAFGLSAAKADNLVSHPDSASHPAAYTFPGYAVPILGGVASGSSVGAAGFALGNFSNVATLPVGNSTVSFLEVPGAQGAAVFGDASVSPRPELSSLALLGTGLCAAAGALRRKGQRA